MPTVKEAGRVYVVLGAGTSAANHTTNTDEPTKGLTDQTELVDALRDQVAYLREQLAVRDEEIRRRDHLLASALERMPALEASQEPPESPTPSPQASEGTTPRSATEDPHSEAEPVQRRSWWRRMFGG